MTIITSDTETAFVFDHDDQLLVIEQGVTLAVEQEKAISDNGRANCMVANYGAIFSSTDTAVGMFGGGSTVVNYATGSIVGDVGVVVSGSGGDLENHGYIHGKSAGVIVAGVARITNTGSINGNLGVQIGSDDNVSIQNSGVIQGVINSVLFLNGNGSVVINNSGDLIGDLDLAGASSSSIRNSGRIEGDVLFGGGDDSFDGRGGADASVHGLRGGDVLRGGGGDDTLVGGLGADRLRGGGGEDVFVYAAGAESRGKSIDVIRGWDGNDVLDLSAIDADTQKAGRQHLEFDGRIDPVDPISAGKVQYYRDNGDTYVVADMNGDGAADLQIRIDGLVSLDSGDFFLG